MKLEELIEKLPKSRRTFVTEHGCKLCDLDDRFIISCDPTTKQKYSIHVNEWILFIRDDLYALNSPIVEFEAYRTHMINKELVTKYKEKGDFNRSMNAAVKKEAVALAKEETIQKFGEKEYYDILGEERLKKAKKEVKKVKEVIKSVRKANNDLTELPKELDTKVDDVTVKQIEKAMEINEDFQKKEANLSDEFDNNEITIPNTEIKVEEVGGEDIQVEFLGADVNDVEPYDIGLTPEEMQETPVENLFDEGFDVNEYLNSDLF